MGYGLTLLEAPAMLGTGPAKDTMLGEGHRSVHDQEFTNR